MEKKVVMIMPKKPKGIAHFSEMPPLGLLTLATLTDKDKFDVKVIDENKDKIDFSVNPDLVCISMSTLLAERGYQIADYYMKKGVQVIIGGMHASALPDEALEHCSSVVIGEAEEIWNEILSDFLNKKLKSVYKQKKPTDISRLLPIDFSYVRKKYLLMNLVQTTRGCIHNCDFCTVIKFYGGKIRHRHIEDVVHEIKNMKQRSKGLFKKWFFIIDDNLIADKKYTKRLFKALIPLKIRIIAQCSLSISADEELLGLAKMAGVRLLYIGFESLDQSFLNNMKKPNKSKNYMESVAKIRKHRIAIVGSFIFDEGHLNSDVFLKTLKFCEDNLDLAEFQPLQPLPGSMLYERTKKELTDFSWSMIRNTNTISGKTSKKLNKKILYCFKHFYSFGQILRRMLRLRKIKVSFKSQIAYFLLNLHLSYQLKALS